MKQLTIKNLVLLAMLTALSLALGMTFQFTMAVGFFTLLDVGIYFTAFYLGKKEGAIVGGLSGLLIDLLLGYPQYMLISLIAHGAQGYLAGFSGKKRPIGLILAAAVMVGTYFIADSYFSNVAKASASLAGNSLQNLIGLVLGYVLARVAKRLQG